jgi:hypothetical protein
VADPLEALEGQDCAKCGREHPDEAHGHDTAFCVSPWGHDPQCMPLQVKRLERLIKAKDAELAEKSARLLYLEGLLNTPHTAEWFEAVRVEAAHQQLRWGAEHDGGKSPPEWLWLLGHLASKAVVAGVKGDVEKAKHHTISSGAVLLNWWRHLAGEAPAPGMRPGIEAPRG